MHHLHTAVLFLHCTYLQISIIFFTRNNEERRQWKQLTLLHDMVKRRVVKGLSTAFVLGCSLITACGIHANSRTLPEGSATESRLASGTEMERGFTNNNILHSEAGDIHFSSYIPDSYTGADSYALFITLPGWEGLYFQGVGANMAEDFGTEAISYNDSMIVLSAQLDDWGQTSAEMTIALTEYFLENYNIDPEKVYLEGYSGGGETGSLVMGMRPDLYAAYLIVSSKWDGDLQVLSDNRTPVYLVTGEDDSYYGSTSFQETYQSLYGLYEEQGFSADEIQKLITLDLKENAFFEQRGFTDQHAGGLAVAHEADIMGWLFGKH